MNSSPEVEDSGVELTEDQQARLKELLAQEDQRHGFNAAHPELNEGEIFLTNIGRQRQEIGGKEFGGQEEFDQIRFLSKRRGEQAYMTDGNPSPDGLPVFISNVEYRNYLSEQVRSGKL